MFVISSTKPMEVLYWFTMNYAHSLVAPVAPDLLPDMMMNSAVLAYVW